MVPTTAPNNASGEPATMATNTPKQKEPEPKEDLDEGIGPYGAGFKNKRPMSAQFNLTVGGHLKLDVIFDDQQINSDLPFFAEPEVARTAAGDVPLDNPNANTNSFNLAAREALLYLAATGPQKGDWSSSGYIEFNFLGFLPGANAGSPTPILRHAYASFSNARTKTSILFGQAEGPFSPIDPQTLNWETLVLIGNPLSRLPQLRLTQQLAPVKLELALVRPADLLNDGQRGADTIGRGQDSGLPEFQARASLTLPGKGRGHYWFFRVPGSIGLSGRFSRERFHAGTANEADVNSYTVNLDWILPVGPLTFQGEVYGGANTDNVFGLAGVAGTLNADALFIPDGEVKEFGGWALLGYNINKELYASLSYGHIQVDASSFKEVDRREDSGLDISLNNAITANLFWTFLPGTFVALEYTRLRTDSFARVTDENGVGQIEDRSGVLNRIQLGFLFSF